jgi:hypothetical protein
MPGDVQVWERPAAEYDIDARRPTVRVKGDQLVRLRRAGPRDLPLADQLEVTDPQAAPRHGAAGCRRPRHGGPRRP